MHIPDNYLSPSTCAVLFLLSFPVLKIASDRIKEDLGMKKTSSLAVYSAFSFIIMMFNIPLPGGTSGHAVGAALTALVLGPWAAVIATSVALIIQAVFFGDGGILSLGANIFNMAIIMPFTAYYADILLGKFSKNRNINAFISGYLALNIGALFTAVEFGIQPILFRDSAGFPLYCPYPLSVAVPAMIIPHLLVAGIIEGIFTAGVFSFILKTSPELLNRGNHVKFNFFYIIIGILTVFTPLGLIAQGTAWGEWGIEEIKQQIGFIPKGMEKGINYKAFMPDYSLAGLGEITAYILSALAALILIFISFSYLKKLKIFR